MRFPCPSCRKPRPISCWRRPIRNSRRKANPLYRRPQFLLKPHCLPKIPQIQRHLFPVKKQHLTLAQKFRKPLRRRKLRLTKGHNRKPGLRACRKKRDRKRLHPQRLLRIPWRRRQNQPLLWSPRKSPQKKLLQQRRWSQPHRPQRKLRNLRILSSPQNLRESPCRAAPAVSGPGHQSGQ